MPLYMKSISRISIKKKPAALGVNTKNRRFALHARIKPPAKLAVFFSAVWQLEFFSRFFENVKLSLLLNKMPSFQYMHSVYACHDMLFSRLCG